MNARQSTASSGADREIPWALVVGFTLFGLSIVGIALGVIPMDPDEIHVPRWVLMLVGLIFVIGGWMPAMGRIDSGSRTPRIVMASVILGMLFVSAWVEFHAKDMPHGSSGSVSPRSAWAFLSVGFSGWFPEQYSRPLLVMLLVIPMGLFALWLIFGRRDKRKPN